MVFPIITFLCALFIAGTAAVYSIIGLTSIFVGATTAVAVMATSLEIGKIVAVSWLYRNWKIAPKLLKCYLLACVCALVLITSLGAWGLLTRAYLEHEQPVTEMQFEIQALETEMEALDYRKTNLQDEIARLNADKGDSQTNYENRKAALETSKKPVQDKIVRLEGKIERLEKNKQEIQSQLDAMYANYAERESRNIITKTAELRKEEKPKRDALSASIEEKDKEIGLVYDDMDLATQELAKINADIVALEPATQQANSRIDEINEELAAFPDKERDLNLQRNRLETKISEQKLEVGPIVFVAEIIYGKEQAEDNIDSAVRWLVILLVVCLDPLACSLVLAANISFARIYERKDKGHELASKLMEKQETDEPEPGPVSTPEPEDERPQPLEPVSEDEPEPVDEGVFADEADIIETVEEEEVEPIPEPEQEPVQEPEPSPPPSPKKRTAVETPAPGQKLQIKKFRCADSGEAAAWQKTHNEEMDALIAEKGRENCEITWFG